MTDEKKAHLAINKAPETEVNAAVSGASDFVEMRTRAEAMPIPDLDKEQGNGYIKPDSRSTLFDLEPYTTEPVARKVTVHVKKTEYERRLPAKRKTSAAKKSNKAKKTIGERFNDYHEANPHVYKMLVALARADVRGGMKHGGMQMYIEQVRFRMRRKTTDRATVFKISNDYAALYARLIMQQESDLAGFFEVRDRKSE
jgi:hypothetical protein